MNIEGTSRFRAGSQPAFLTRFRGEAAQTGMEPRRATEGSAGVLDSTSRSPTERNAVDMPGSAAAVETWWEMQAGLSP
jgi:hypothetical protein